MTLIASNIRPQTVVKQAGALAPDRDALTAEIAALSKASIKDLRERWKTLYGKEPSAISAGPF